MPWKIELFSDLKGKVYENICSHLPLWEQHDLTLTETRKRLQRSSREKERHYHTPAYAEGFSLET